MEEIFVNQEKLLKRFIVRLSDNTNYLVKASTLDDAIQKVEKSDRLISNIFDLRNFNFSYANDKPGGNNLLIL